MVPGSLGLCCVGDTSLFWWPEEGRLVRVVRRAPFTHVVRYRRSDATFTADVDTLLDAASHGIRWVRLVRSPSVHDPRSVLSSVIDRDGPNASAYMPREGSAEMARASYAHVRSKYI